MKTLSIDIETHCELPLAGHGVYKYAAHPSFEILLFAYSADRGPVKVVDLAQGEKIPENVINALSDERVEKHAFNAAFERVCLSAHLKNDTGFLPARGWYCTMVEASEILGAHLSLDACAKALGLPVEKMAEGKRLIRLFSQPCKPTKKNGGRTRNHPKDMPDDWEMFKDYCKRDVEVEQAIHERLAKSPVPVFEWENYWIDQKINDRGVLIDMSLVEQAIAIDEENHAEKRAALQNLTGLDNPNSPSQLLAWLQGAGLQIDSLDKKTVATALKDATGDIHQALHLRTQLAKSSVKKYEAMRKCAGEDMRARGLFQFVGAGATGRWAGRLIQMQNLPRQQLGGLHVARELVKNGEGDLLELVWGSTSRVLSELIRTAFVSETGRLLVADYSAIEARVLAWLAGEDWVLRLFENGGDIYCETGSRMFSQPVMKGNPLRQKAKVAVLACGYGGGDGALKAMGASDMGLSEREIHDLVVAWRVANPRIVQFWYDIDKAAKATIMSGRTMIVGKIEIGVTNGILYIQLPSGRRLAYPAPSIGVNRFGGESITHMGLDFARRWTRVETYGGKLVENITQAVARDLLADAIMRLEKAGYAVVGHVHDEVIVEASKGNDLDEMNQIMSKPPSWARGLPLASEGFESAYYKKG
ncbi:DNA polymerase [Schaalia sp. lx-100]|uniref:DNA polymerase n=1 Tax=Schaalia sp. lx-100 TaxID=2899081 RepID=UPI001E4DDF99|nr:DNA polymerase [Schaalia sp. lx-100]MCD4557190.1 DNA polymerase [Schaalia sp. lx-100]